MAPDTQQNVLVALRLLLLHNALAILFFSGLVSAFAYALWKPSRAAILFILGFLLLFLAFEYNKHIAEPLIQQTTTSLITERQSWRLAWVIERILGSLLPPALYTAGTFSLFIGVWLLWKRSGRHR